MGVFFSALWNVWGNFIVFVVQIRVHETKKIKKTCANEKKVVPLPKV